LKFLDRCTYNAATGFRFVTKSNDMKKTNANQEVNLIKTIETISMRSAKTQLREDRLSGISQEIKQLSEYLKVTTTQAILCATIIDYSLIGKTNFETLSRHYNLSPLSVISLMDEIEVLAQRGFIRKNIRSRDREHSYKDIYYRVPNQIIDGIRKKDHSIVVKKTKFDLPVLLEEIYRISEERENKIISTRQLADDVTKLIDANKDKDFIKYVDSTISQPINQCIALVLAYKNISGSPEVELSEFADDIFDNVGDQFKFTKGINQQIHELIKKDIIQQHKNEIGFNIIQLSNATVQKLYGEEDRTIKQEVQSSMLIKPASIKAKRLYFNSNLQQDIDALYKALSNRNFNQLRRQLAGRNFNSGITVLLYGASGVGKTEVTYQIAKKTHREILMVDLSETHSKWFGESEKLVKKLFDDYRLASKEAKNCPILMINEVDGLLSKRMDLGNHATSSDQVRNTIQNIILQELEFFDGILIATTNLTVNLDKAFDRRFLFKIRFSNPDALARYHIWKSRLPELPNQTLKEISEKYSLTGGQIENVVKKVLVNQVLARGDQIESILRICSEEAGYGTRKAIGFK